MTCQNIYKDKHCKLANFMYNAVYKAALILIKKRRLYIILNYTWGLITTLIGLIISLILLCTNHRPLKYYSTWYFKVCKSWGGLELGSCFIRDNTSTEHVNKHEYGHTFQNAILGPFFIVLVWLPSAIRYWYQRIRIAQHKQNKPYDQIWFEGNATDIGYYASYCDSVKKGEIK